MVTNLQSSGAGPNPVRLVSATLARRMRDRMGPQEPIERPGLLPTGR
ncbi:hypothetical protein ACFV27_39685 [Streptomyces antimycoticus]|nr:MULTISPECIES: hypothetical protein [Streptomyces]QTI88091.1 hypothetical protein AS97_45435 [Streptomyces sp. AgN23]